MKNIINNTKNYAVLGKMSFYEKSLLFLVTFILPIILLFKQDEKLIFLYLFLFVCWENALGDKYFKNSNEHPYGYKYVLLLMQILHLFLIFGLSILIIIFILKINYEIVTIIITLLFTFIFVLYMLISVVVMFYIGNFLFFFILKMIFPNQFKTNQKEETLSLREMSCYLTIEEQIGYFLTLILHLLLYFGVVFYFSLWLLQIDNTINDISYFDGLVNWSYTNQIISLGNSLGIASIIITMLSLSVPVQMKLHSKVLKRKNETLN
ncbi:hypothetical protein ACIQXF_06545 [Lysinibacillus sp. NPDC097231]|uniref:hypothetical protein n=1 Tax=Lysinibacillus sp. NPDC097231 TaxID=3364142 RepID=UPI0037F90278